MDAHSESSTDGAEAGGGDGSVALPGAVRIPPPTHVTPPGCVPLPRGIPEWARGTVAEVEGNLIRLQYMHAVPPYAADGFDETQRMPKVPLSDRIFMTGRRKTATARVCLTPGPGRIVVNGRPYWVYFQHPLDRYRLVMALAVTRRLGQYDAVVRVDGGGISAQAQAARHGLAKALQEAEPELRAVLRPGGLLVRDRRVVERKKYGRKKARKQFQWVKR